MLKAFAGVLANRNDSSASPIMKFAAYILLASNQDVRTSKCSISFADSKDDELTILLGAMLGNVSNLAPPHYTCSYYLLTMYEYENVLIKMIPVFNTLPYKEPDLGLDPKPNGGSSSSVTKYATNKLVLTKTGLTSNKVIVLLDEPNAKKGKTVKLQTISDISINVLDVIIKDKNGNKVETTKLNNNEYSFTMPGSDIDIEVIYEEKILREEEQALKEINDKLTNEEFKLVASKNKDKINENAKFIEGYEDGTLRLDDEVSNIELMCMITKLFKDETFDKELKEVNLNQGENYWGEEVLRKANFLNLIPGDKENYDLNKKATRYDMAKVIYDLLGDDKETENENICKDVTKYEKEISKLMGLGIIKGCDDGLFHGERTLTREEAIVIINRTLRTLGFKLEIKKIETSYRDLSKDRWSYSEIMYATNH